MGQLVPGGEIGRHGPSDLRISNRLAQDRCGIGANKEKTVLWRPVFLSIGFISNPSGTAQMDAFRKLLAKVEQKVIEFGVRCSSRGVLESHPPNAGRASPPVAAACSPGAGNW